MSATTYIQLQGSDLRDLTNPDGARRYFSGVNMPPKSAPKGEVVHLPGSEDEPGATINPFDGDFLSEEEAAADPIEDQPRLPGMKASPAITYGADLIRFRGQLERKFEQADVPGEVRARFKIRCEVQSRDEAEQLSHVLGAAILTLWDTRSSGGGQLQIQAPKLPEDVLDWRVQGTREPVFFAAPAASLSVHLAGETMTATFSVRGVLPYGQLAAYDDLPPVVELTGVAVQPKLL